MSGTRKRPFFIGENHASEAGNEPSWRESKFQRRTSPQAERPSYSQAPNMTSLNSNNEMVVAIDFGTTYSGYAFSLGTEFERDPVKISSRNWGGQASHKAPTCVLLKPDQTFYKFGYEAEDWYNMQAEAGNSAHKDYYYFRRFKMDLYTTPNLSRDLMIKDETGKQMLALTVFTHGIRYLKEDALSLINTQGKLTTTQAIHWVLTVPAIWSDGAKQFMREAAIEAGLEDSNLSIALEPEAAAVYCRYLPAYQLAGNQRKIIEPGSRYMVLDLGGGTADITVYSVLEDNKLCEICAPSGGPWGGTKVDEAYLRFWRETLGSELMNGYSLQFMEDFFEMFRDFERKKRTIKLDMSETPCITTKVPCSLFSFYLERKGRSLSRAFESQNEYDGVEAVTTGKIRIPSRVMQSFFQLSINELVDHIKGILDQLPIRGADTSLIMVGGYSESPFVQDKIKLAFPNKRVIVPSDAGLAVLKGAVIFGHAPMVMTSRVCRYTYGIAVRKPFVLGTYPRERMVREDGREIVRDVFYKFVSKGDILDVGKIVDARTLTMSGGDSRASVRIFASNKTSPEFVTDNGCISLGEIEVTLPEVLGRLDRTVNVRMIFGGTELMVEARDTNTGRVFRSKFDFLRGN